MEPESFEFLLSQYLDGLLSDQERAAVDQRLLADPVARAMLNDFQSLDTAVRAAAPPLPRVHWDRLAETISAAVDDRASGPIFTIGWVKLAAAASILLAVGMLGLWLRHPARRIENAGPVAEIEVVGPQAEAASGPETIEISIGQPRELDAAAGYTDDGVLVQRPLVALDGFTNHGAGEMR